MEALNVILFKNGIDLKETLSGKILTYTRPYTISFATDGISLSRILKKYPNSILFYISNSLLNIDRTTVRQVQNNFPNVSISLCTNETFAIDAWNLKVFDFITYPVTLRDLKKSISHFLNMRSMVSEYLPLKSKDGIINIPLRSIAYLKAQGNYTLIQTISGKKYLPTKQIQFFESLSEQSIHIQRVHNSYILNFQNIKSIKGEELVFFGGQSITNLSQRLNRKVKNIILGKSIKKDE